MVRQYDVGGVAGSLAKHAKSEPRTQPRTRQHDDGIFFVSPFYLRQEHAAPAERTPADTRWVMTALLTFTGGNI